MFILQNIYSQRAETSKIPVINFDHLESYFHKDDDSVYLVNFCATWRVPCRDEMPAIKAVEEKYSHEKFKVLLVSKLLVAKQKGFTFPYLFDGAQ
jgi:thiol-disulfide isomerase/thioredoxin